MIKIDDINAKELEYYTKYSEAQLLHIFEPQLGLFIAETPLVIERALKAGYEPVSFLVDEECAVSAHMTITENYKVPIYVGENSIIKNMTGFNLTRGMLCAMRRRELQSVTEVCQGAKRIAILEDVMNPVNIGAIFRSAAALGVEAILLTKNGSDPLYRRASRVGMGAAFQIPWTYLNSTDNYLDEIKNLGFSTVAMALREDSIGIDDSRLKSVEKLAIVLGNEGFGLKEATIEACDFTAKIPMYHEIDSLNVAAAGAVIFWELCK